MASPELTKSNTTSIPSLHAAYSASKASAPQRHPSASCPRTSSTGAIYRSQSEASPTIRTRYSPEGCGGSPMKWARVSMSRWSFSDLSLTVSSSSSTSPEKATRVLSPSYCRSRTYSSIASELVEEAPQQREPHIRHSRRPHVPCLGTDIWVSGSAAAPDLDPARRVASHCHRASLRRSSRCGTGRPTRGQQPVGTEAPLRR
jgi:hypothetical protein